MYGNIPFNAQLRLINFVMVNWSYFNMTLQILCIYWKECSKDFLEFLLFVQFEFEYTFDLAFE